MARITQKSLEMLMDCHERELMKQEPCSTYKTQVARGLILLGYFTSEMYTSPTSKKRYMAFYVTEAGKNYLSKLA